MTLIEWECGACGALMLRQKRLGKAYPMRHNPVWKDACNGHLGVPDGIPPPAGWGPK